MCLKENKDNLRTIISKILVAKRNKPDRNESLILTFSPQRQTDQFHVADGTTTVNHDGKVVSTSMRNIQQMMMSRPVEVAVAPKTSLS